MPRSDRCTPMRLLVLAGYLVVVAEEVGGTLREEWTQHVRRVSRFPCGTPQNRTVLVQELVSDETWKEIENYPILPAKTVLQRCTSAGSCDGTKDCEPDAIEHVRLIFAVINGSKPHYLEMEAVNHKSCSCQKGENRPK